MIMFSTLLARSDRIEYKCVCVSMLQVPRLVYKMLTMDLMDKSWTNHWIGRNEEEEEDDDGGEKKKMSQWRESIRSSGIT